MSPSGGYSERDTGSRADLTSSESLLLIRTAVCCLSTRLPRPGRPLAYDGGWLNKTMQSSKTHPSDLHGIDAWIGMKYGHPGIPKSPVPRTPGLIRIQADTHPDELVYAIR